MQYQVTLKDFSKLKVSPEWGFASIRSTEQWTHGYHRYPAKFLPNLVKKIIEEYTQPEDLIADFFAGCGTTLVEAKIHGRPSIGVDINPVAELITKAKISAIEPKKLTRAFNSICKRFDEYKEKDFKEIELHEKIDYWFTPENKFKIAFLYDVILSKRDKTIREFFLVSLSHILKNCSKWLQSSTKPQIDPDKASQDPFVAFEKHTQQMIKKNEEFFNKLKADSCIQTKCEIKLEDARSTSLEEESVSAIITSPPYVTSYEYADIHQLTSYWYEYITDLKDFRKNFIGTFYSLNQNTNVKSPLAKRIINKLNNKNSRTAKEVANYFNDMNSVLLEMHRVLKPEGYVFLVVGNTKLLNVQIKSAEVLADYLESLDFEIVDAIKRSIPNKLIPTIRDKKTGKFSKLNNKNSKLVYPEEYIIIAKKLNYGSNQKR
jgi:DNA modification methylase